MIPGMITAILSVVLIDLVLGGDNAIVIGLAARNLPKQIQKKAIVWGTAGAISIRILATFLVVFLLRIPGLQLIGGLVLVWMAYRLLTDEKKDHEAKASTDFKSAIMTIIVADFAMGLDNILAVAGTAQNNFMVVIFGLLISIPIIVFGSTIVIKLIDRFPVIIYIGSAVIAHTAGKMITHESFVKNVIAPYPTVVEILSVLIVVGVLAAGKLKIIQASKLRKQH